MEKSSLIALMQDRLIEMNLSTRQIQKHLNVFSMCFNNKSSAEIDILLKQMGGIESILKGIYNLEKIKLDYYNQKVEEEKRKIYDQAENADESCEVENLIDEKAFEQAVFDEKLQIEKQIENAETNNDQESTVECKTPPSIDVNEQAEFAEENAYLEFPLEIPETENSFTRKFKSFRRKLTDTQRKALIPIAILAITVLFAVFVLMFPVYVLLSVLFAALFLGVITSGSFLSVGSLIYAFFQFQENTPVFLYETGLGIAIIGLTLLLSVLIYNLIKRLIPLLFSFNKKCIVSLVTATKIFFSSKEEAEK